MTWRRLLLVAGLVAAAAFAVTPAGADDVPIEEVARLAEAGDTDGVSRERLESITSIDGAPVDMASILDGDSDEVAQRLRTLADLGGRSPQPRLEGARDDAAAILAGREYQRTETSPGVIERIVAWLANLIPDSIGAALSSTGLWIFIAVTTLAVGLFFFARNSRRRRTAGSRDGSVLLDGTPRHADDIERHARRAADDGDYSLAVRLWFEAGAIRLAEQGLVPHEATSTSGVIRRAVPSPTMAQLTSTFDQVAYGNRAASHDDATGAEQGWTAIRTETARHG